MAASPHAHVSPPARQRWRREAAAAGGSDHLRLVLGQEAIAHKSNENPAARTLASGLDLAGRVVTLDALHAQDHTARHLVEHCRAHYVMTAVKSNRLNLLADLAVLDWERPEVRATEQTGLSI